MPTHPIPSNRRVAFFKVKYKDVFSMGILYEQFRDFLMDKGWESTIGHPSTGADEMEARYLEKVDAKGFREIRFHWRLAKSGESTYMKDYLDIDAQVIALTDHEVMLYGKKTKINKGEIEFTIKGWLVTDPGNKWGNHWFLSKIKKLWEDRIYGGEIASAYERLHRQLYDIQDWLKHSFEMKRFKGPKREWRQTVTFPSHIRKE